MANSPRAEANKTIEMCLKNPDKTGEILSHMAKNRDLADLLLKWALEKKYGRIRLRSLDDHLEQRYKKKLGL